MYLPFTRCVVSLFRRMSIILVIVLFCCSNVVSQTHSAFAKLDSTDILIGDHVNLTLHFSSSANIDVTFPLYCDTCLDGIEIVRRSSIDTIDTKGVGIELQQRLTVTAFDSGTHILPSFLFYGLDSMLLAQTESLILNVQTIAVDTTLAIKDIKEPLSAPISFREALPYIIIALIVFGLFVGGFFLIRHLKKKKKPKSLQKKKSELPAHIIALRDLDKLWQKKLCQSGHTKQHYSELTDIVRTYIDNRWNIMAMEMVSSEIVIALEPLGLPMELVKKLEHTLSLADMVKFAKENPLPNEDNMCYHNIVDFVQATKKIEEVTKKIAND